MASSEAKEQDLLPSKAFSVEMRSYTKDIHTISDNLVNAKVALAANDDRVWGEGLLVFYEIYRRMEEALDHTDVKALKKMDIPGLRRKSAFEEDLDFYLGPDWRKKEKRKEVQAFLDHLDQIEEQNSMLLIAHIYHQYMGLLSGGQILRRKQQIVQSLKIWGPKASFDEYEHLPGHATTHFPGKDGAQNLKKALRESLNEIGETLDPDTRRGILEESVQVFAFNNQLVRSIKAADEVFRQKVIYITLFIVILAVILAVLLMKL